MNNESKIFKSFATPIRPRRPVQKLSNSEKKILEFLVNKLRDVDFYSTYGNDPQLKKATGKSQQALNVALRKLWGWTLLESSGRGMPILYWIDPKKVPFVRNVLARSDGCITMWLVLGWARHQMGWFTTRDVAKLLNISKRHAQKLVKILVEQGLIRRTRLSGRGYKGRVVYTESKGQLPLDHFTRSLDVLKNIKHTVYTTLNEFS